MLGYAKIEQLTHYPGCLWHLATHLRGNSKLVVMKMVLLFTLRSAFILQEIS